MSPPPAGVSSGAAQPELPGMPDRLVVATPSRLGAFADCPRRYRYAYLDRPTPPKGPPWAHQSLGASVHTALRNWYEVPAPRRDPQLAPTLLKATWVREGYRDLPQEREMWRHALRWLESYLPELPAEPVGVERVVAARTRVMAFHGRADRIDARAAGGDSYGDGGDSYGDDGAAEGRAGGRGGELVIVDYKTGRAAPGQDEARGSPALSLYAYAAGQVFRRPCQRVELHHLPTGTVAAAELSEPALARQVSRAEATAGDIRTAERAVAAGADPDQAFPAVPGPRCGWCDFRRACPAGRELPGKEPWAGLP